MPLNDVTWRDGLPVPAPPRLDLEGEALLVVVPGDWDAVCRADIGLAREWQAVVRRSFEAAFARGYATVDCLSEPEGDRPLVAYVLRRPGRDSTWGSLPVTAGRAGSDDHSLHDPG